MRCAAIGIDLGTTFSAVGFCSKDEKITVIHNDEGNPITPSVVHFDQNDEHFVGEVALRKRSTHPRRTFSEIKRFIGRDHDDTILKQRNWPFELIAKKYIDSPKDAVITVPASFTNIQRQATMHAGQFAGLNVLQIINEPTAAALAFCHKNPSKAKRKILVYDLGGGTFDVSIVESDGNQMKVLSTNGATFLGGVDFDLEIYKEAVARFRSDGIDVPNGDWTLMEACEKAKKVLARLPSARIDYTTKNGKHVGFDLTHDTFVDLCENLFDQTMRLVDKAITDARLAKKDLDEIVLVGGSTRMVYVRKLLTDHFPGKKIRTDVEPDLAVAQGAALVAATLSNGNAFTEEQLRPATEKRFSRIMLIDVTPHSLGLRLDRDLMSILIPKNTSIPFETTEIYTNAEDFDNHLTIEIVEGENDKASLNVELAKFRIRVTPKKKNENSIEVRFNINKSGILEVTAIDKDTNKRASITVQSGSLDSEEREKITRQLALVTLNG